MALGAGGRAGESAAVRAGWREAPLGSIATIVNGGTPDTKVPAYWDGGIAWLTPKDMGKAADAYATSTSRTISEAGLRNSSARTLPPSSVILSTRAPIGHLAINQVGMAFNQGCRGLIPGKDLISKYLFYFLLSNVSLLNELGTGTTFKELSASALSRVPVPVPPLAEQQRIVAILDEAFEAIATATANAERNARNARELFRLVAQALLSEPTDGWRKTPLGELCELYQPRTISRAEMVADGPYPVFGANGYIGRYYSYNHDEPQLLVTCRGATCGSVNMSLSKSWVTGNSMVIRPSSDAISTRYIRIVLENAFDFVPTITGSAQPQITRQSLAPAIVAYPKNVNEQFRICETLESIKAETASLGSTQTRKLALLAELKQSLLARAFSGELTAGDAKRAA